MCDMQAFRPPIDIDSEQPITIEFTSASWRSRTSHLRPTHATERQVYNQLKISRSSWDVSCNNGKSEGVVALVFGIWSDIYRTVAEIERPSGDRALCLSRAHCRIWNDSERVVKAIFYRPKNRVLPSRQFSQPDAAQSSQLDKRQQHK